MPLPHDPCRRAYGPLRGGSTDGGLAVPSGREGGARRVDIRRPPEEPSRRDYRMADCRNESISKRPERQSPGDEVPYRGDGRDCTLTLPWSGRVSGLRATAPGADRAWRRRPVRADGRL